MGHLHRHLRPRFSPTAVFDTTTSSTVDFFSIFFPSAVTTSSTSDIITSVSLPTTTSLAAPIATTTSTSSIISITPTLIPTTSSTTSITPITTSSTSVAPAPTTTTTSSSPTLVLVPTTLSDGTDTTLVSTDVTFQTATRSLAAAAATSSTSTVTPKATTSTGMIAGGISAAVIGIVGILVAMIYLLRRCRRVNRDSSDFNAEAVRRQSTMLADDGSEERITPAFLRSGSGRGPRPPTMIERHLANHTPVSYGAYGATAYGATAWNQPSFSPGEIVSPVSPPPTGPGSAQPFFHSHGQSPAASPAAYDSAYDEHGQPAQGAVLTRHNSFANSFAVPSTPAPGDPHYVDLNRSSISPFQAEQYEEISRRIGAPAPKPLPVVIEDADDKNLPGPPPDSRASGHTMFASQAGVQHRSLAVLADAADPESPFADPSLRLRSESGGHEYEHEAEAEAEAEGQELVVPRTQSPRITSTPPVLPEIALQGRAMSPILGGGAYDFPVPVSAGPSPFSQQFNIQTPKTPAFVSTAPAPAAVPRVEKVIVQRPETVYDPEDAYGGI